MKILGVQKLELPESVKSILMQQSEVSRGSTGPETRVRQDSESASQVGFNMRVSEYSLRSKKVLTGNMWLNSDV